MLLAGMRGFGEIGLAITTGRRRVSSSSSSGQRGESELQESAQQQQQVRGREQDAVHSGTNVSHPPIHERTQMPRALTTDEAPRSSLAQ
jgi:hypothetical protein